MLTKRCRLGAAALNGKLYVCGGYDGSVFLRTVEAYDPVTNRSVMTEAGHRRRISPTE